MIDTLIPVTDHVADPLRFFEALVLDENADRLYLVAAPSRRALMEYVDGFDFASAAILGRTGKVVEEWGECSVPLGRPVDRKIWVE